MTNAVQLSFFDVFDAEMSPSVLTEVAASVKSLLAANDPLVGAGIVLPGDEDVESLFQSVYGFQ